MQPSAEVRWFHTEPLPEEIQIWFQRGSPTADKNDSRTDSYLVFPGSTFVGVKLREGRLEIKAQRSPAREVRYPHGIVGSADGWIKFPLASPHVPKLETAIASTGRPLVIVRKRRWLQRYSLETGHLEMAAANDRPAEGWLFELTGLEVGERRFWTLGLEAFGAAEHVDATLATIANYVFAPEPFPTPLPYQKSLSYPAWLLSL